MVPPNLSQTFESAVHEAWGSTGANDWSIGSFALANPSVHVAAPASCSHRQRWSGVCIGSLGQHVGWGDIQFGESEEDTNRFILVQRHYYMGHFGTSKTHECRRVDMSKHLRAVLMAHKESALFRAFQLGKTSIADELVFPSEAGTPICPDNIGPRYMEPALEQAGLRKFRFHDLRHTFGSLLIQAGISPAYVQKQMGHRSIQVTIDVYGHLIPGENVAWIDTLRQNP